MSELFVGVDGGNSKTDVAVATRSGQVVAIQRGPGSSPDKLGFPKSAAVVVDTIEKALRQIGASLDQVRSVSAYVAGLDLPEDAPRLRENLLRILPDGVRVVADNDTMAALLAGTKGGPGLVVVCGAGINAMALDVDGHRTGYLSLGVLSGDWGGGIALGREVIWSAARAEDGRGRPTVLSKFVCEHYGTSSVADAVMMLHRGELALSTLPSLVPLLYRAAESDDEIARDIVDKLMAEVVAMVSALVARSGALSVPFPVVLAGGVLVGAPVYVREHLHDAIGAAHPDADVQLLRVKPVAGALLNALDRLGHDGYHQRVLAGCENTTGLGQRISINVPTTR